MMAATVEMAAVGGAGNSWGRHRMVAAMIGGGPDEGIHWEWCRLVIGVDKGWKLGFGEEPIADGGNRWDLEKSQLWVEVKKEPTTLEVRGNSRRLRVGREGGRERKEGISQRW